MNFDYRNPEDIKIGDILTNIQQSKIWIVLNKDPTEYKEIYRFSYMNFDGKIKTDSIEREVKVLER